MLVSMLGFVLIFILIDTIMPHHASSHLECRKLVCGVCLRKEKHTQAITPTVLALIKEHHYDDYSLQDDFLPLIACKSCVATLKAIDKV